MPLGNAKQANYLHLYGRTIRILELKLHGNRTSPLKNTRRLFRMTGGVIERLRETGPLIQDGESETISFRGKGTQSTSDGISSNRTYYGGA